MNSAMPRTQPERSLDAPGLLPNLIIAGAPKCGTSSLHRWLEAHPDVLGSSEKETYFFADPGTHMFRPESHVSKGLDAYRDYFRPIPGSAPRVVLESTPSYLYSATALERIPELPTDPKIIFILREPSAQVFSLFNFFKNSWTWIPSELTFAEYLEEISQGRGDYRGNELAANALRNAAYVDFLLQWRNRFGSERMRVWLFDDLVADPRAFAKKAAEFVGLDPAFFDSFDFPKSNETFAVRSRRLHEVNVAVRAVLPKGNLYKAARSVYRMLNTRKPDPVTTDERRLRQDLKLRFAEANARLAEEFGLDLSNWR
ncbi:sulfotransferase [bacterium]|nr:sulfotransferase [bacterium]